ncbi:MAG: PAS domain-containing protein [Ferrovibrio sp.]|uniref:PAS domain-containing protein n=1 Tax=Ferrovibrio sp. TaxID=1917215 RepID=UPI00391C27F1
MDTFATLPRVSLEIGHGRIADIPDDRLQMLARYWFSRARSGEVPLRADIDPLDFPALLPNVMLLDRVTGRNTDDDRYRFRLAGTHVALYTGRELTGCYLDEVLPAGYLDYVRLLNRTVLAECLPVYTSSLYHDEGNFVNGITYRLVMPLRYADSATPDIIFFCQFWQRRKDQGCWSGDWLDAKPEVRVIHADGAAENSA